MVGLIVYVCMVKPNWILAPIWAQVPIGQGLLFWELGIIGGSTVINICRPDQATATVGRERSIKLGLLSKCIVCFFLFAWWWCVSCWPAWLYVVCFFFFLVLLLLSLLRLFRLLVLEWVLLPVVVDEYRKKHPHKHMNGFSTHTTTVFHSPDHLQNVITLVVESYGETWFVNKNFAQ